MSEFLCRVCNRDLRATVEKAIENSIVDFGFQRKRDGRNGDSYRVVEVECPEGHLNSFRLRAAIGGG